VRSDQSTQAVAGAGLATDFVCDLAGVDTADVGRGSNPTKVTPISFGVALNPGSTLDVFGMQVEGAACRLPL